MNQPTPQQINSVIASGVIPALEAAADVVKRQDYQPVEYADLTPEHQAKWRDTQNFMMYKFSGFLHIWANMLNGQKLSPPTEYMPVFTRDVPYAATDGHSAMLNPDTMFAMGLLERAFVCNHEIMHNARGDVEFRHRCILSGKVPMHDGSFLPFDDQTLQEAMDLVINAGLVEGNMGRMPKDKNGQQIGLYEPAIKSTHSFLDVYRDKYEEQFGTGGQPGNKPGKGKDKGGQPGQGQPNPGGGNPRGFDQLRGPSTATGQAPQPRDPGKWKIVVEQAAHIDTIKNHGRMPAGLERLYSSLMDSEVPWVDHIETLIKRNVGDGSYDFSQPDPWLGATPEGEDYFAPKPAGVGAGWILVGGDTSGSRNAQEIANNISELAGIMEAVNPARLTVAWWEDGPPSVEEITEATDLRKLKPIGGGGTDMDGFLEWTKDQFPEEPDMMIIFTDGHLVFPPEKQFPNCPVIWAISTDKAAPFGQRVQVCKSKRQL